MIKKVKILACVFSVIFIHNALSQISIKPVKIGDKIPSIIFNDVLNFKSKQVDLTDFRGKLIILDVWNRWCSSCIAAFPEMENLQAEYKNEIQIFLVTDDKMSDFVSLKNRSYIVNSTTLPIVIGDTIIGKLFPHIGVPLHIWIDSCGIVKAITSGTSTTSKSIKKYLNSNTVDFIKRDNELIDFDYRKSLLTEGGGRNIKHLESYSLLMKSLENYRLSVSTIMSDTITKKSIGLKFINSDLPSLISLAFGNENVLLDFHNSDLYLRPTNDPERMKDYIENYNFCYEVKVAQNFYDSITVMRKVMRGDLMNYFDINVRSELRKIQCFNLVQIGNIDQLKCSELNLAPIYENRSDLWIIQNKSIQYLLNSVSKVISPDLNHRIPIINKTTIDGNITLKLKLKDSTISSVNKELKKFNLQIIPSEIEVNVLIVKKN